MSPISSESYNYKWQREQPREYKMWEEKRKLDPELTEEYDRLVDKYEKMVIKHNSVKGKIYSKIKKLRYDIENSTIESVREQRINKILK